MIISISAIDNDFSFGNFYTQSYDINNPTNIITQRVIYNVHTGFINASNFCVEKNVNYIDWKSQPIIQNISQYIKTTLNVKPFHMMPHGSYIDAIFSTSGNYIHPLLFTYLILYSNKSYQYDEIESCAELGTLVTDLYHSGKTFFDTLGSITKKLEAKYEDNNYIEQIPSNPYADSSDDSTIFDIQLLKRKKSNSDQIKKIKEQIQQLKANKK
jgi:hypothetical protein